MLLAGFLASWALTAIHMCLASDPGATTRYAEERRLFEDVFDPLDNRVRPGDNFSQALPVEIVMLPVFFKGLDEPLQTLQMVAWIYVKWTNPQTTWDPEKYGGVDMVTLPAEEMWFPDIGIINSAVHLYGEDIFDKERYRMTVYSTGLSQVVYAGTIETICTLDLTFFPFDEQICHIEFDSWSLPMDHLFLANSSHMLTRNLRENGIWEVTETSTVFHEEWSLFEHQFRTVSFVFRLKRKSTSVMLSVTLPCLLLFLLESLIFWIPPEAGEKISLGITIMLSITVFQLVIDASMPKTSDYVPIMYFYLGGVMFVSALTLVMTVIVMGVHHRDPNRPVPRWLRRSILGVVARALCFSPRKNPVSDYNAQNIDLDTTKRLDSSGEEPNIWITVARILDKLFFAVFMLIAGFLSFGMIIACVAHAPSRNKPIGGYGYTPN